MQGVKNHKKEPSTVWSIFKRDDKFWYNHFKHLQRVEMGDHKQAVFEEESGGAQGEQELRAPQPEMTPETASNLTDEALKLLSQKI